MDKSNANRGVHRRKYWCRHLQKWPLDTRTCAVEISGARLAEALLCCYYIIFGYRTKYGGIREHMVLFDIYFGTECFLNSCTGVVLFSGMQKFRIPKEELVENPTCHCITKFVDEPLESLRLYIAWAIVAAVLCFSGSVALSFVLKWGDIPAHNLKDDSVLKKHDKLRDTSIFSSVVFYFIYAVFKALVLIVLCKFYCHHLRKVKNGQPLYTPYDHGAHREHRRVFAAAPPPSERSSRFAVLSEHAGSEHAARPRTGTSNQQHAAAAAAD